MNQPCRSSVRLLAGVAVLLACSKDAAPLRAAAPRALTSSDDAKVTVGSPQAEFPRNVQNEPGLAVDPTNPLVLAVGTNDGIDGAPCAGSSCRLVPGVGGQGIYFSFDGGKSWTQPEYTGWSARTGTGQVGPIGTVPNYYENKLTAVSDPALAFGPRPGPAGFDWANGSRLYFGAIALNFPGATTFTGTAAITVSHADDLVAAAAGDASAWSAPVIVTEQQQTTASDKEAVWADNASSSPFFGNVYECDDGNHSKNPVGTNPQPIVFSRSTDGGATWTAHQISPADDPHYGGVRFGGRVGCTIRTDSAGGVYVFWAGATSGPDAIFMTRSFDGGRHFEHPRPVAHAVACGAPDPVSGLNTFDGVGGTRTATLPAADVANGAPTGAGASDAIALIWCDATFGLDHEEALVQISTDGGKSWTAPVNAAAAGDRPDVPSVAIAPGGADLYVAYDAFLAPWQEHTADPRPFQGVVRHASVAGGAAGQFADLHRSSLGDARATSRRTVEREFIYDYISIVATPAGAAAVWMDGRNAVDCPAIDAYRESLLTANPLPRPAPNTDCPPGFGNLDVYGGFYSP